MFGKPKSFRALTLKDMASRFSSTPMEVETVTANRVYSKSGLKAEYKQYLLDVVTDFKTRVNELNSNENKGNDAKFQLTTNAATAIDNLSKYFDTMVEAVSDGDTSSDMRTVFDNAWYTAMKPLAPFQTEYAVVGLMPYIMDVYDVAASLMYGKEMFNKAKQAFETYATFIYKSPSLGKEITQSLSSYPSSLSAGTSAKLGNKLTLAAVFHPFYRYMCMVAEKATKGNMFDPHKVMARLDSFWLMAVASTDADTDNARSSALASFKTVQARVYSTFVSNVQEAPVNVVFVTVTEASG